jgi:hypothetical protein
MTTSAISGKCRGQRISRRDLVLESKQRLKECGVDNRQHAYYSRLLAESVVGNPNALFAQRQPKKPKSEENVAWREAYAIAIQFLKDFDLHETLGTVKVERPWIIKYKCKLNLSLAHISGSASAASISSQPEQPVTPPPKENKKPNLTIIPPDRVSDTEIRSPTRHSPVGKEILVPVPEGSAKKPPSPRLPPLGDPVKPKSNRKATRSLND